MTRWPRRKFLTRALGMIFPSACALSASVESRLPLHFPRDFGAHPETLTEWWYITGWLEEPSGSKVGMQITFFRSRPRVQEGNPSAFAPKQLLFAHAALSDPATGRLQHDERSARAGFG